MLLLLPAWHPRLRKSLRRLLHSLLLHGHMHHLLMHALLWRNGIRRVPGLVAPSLNPYRPWLFLAEVFMPHKIFNSSKGKRPAVVWHTLATGPTSPLRAAFSHDSGLANHSSTSKCKSALPANLPTLHDYVHTPTI